MAPFPERQEHEGASTCTHAHTHALKTWPTGLWASLPQMLCLALHRYLQSVPWNSRAADPGQAAPPNCDLFVLMCSLNKGQSQRFPIQFLSQSQMDRAQRGPVSEGHLWGYRCLAFAGHNLSLLTKNLLNKYMNYFKATTHSGSTEPDFWRRKPDMPTRAHTWS